MPQTYSSVYLHIVFSTKNRAHLLTPSLHQEFAKYLTPILKDCKAHLVCEGGMQDHVHLLIDLGRETSISTLLREIKAKSSQWLKRRLNGTFSWQGGYAVFSVSPTHLEKVIGYIRNQEEHHRQKTFVEELEEMLRVAGIEYEPKYLWQKEEA